MPRSWRTSIGPTRRREAGELKLSFSRDATKLEELARGLGASSGTPAEAVQFAEVVVFSVPWSELPNALEQSFNTLTARFQAEAAGRDGDRRVVQWLCGDDESAKRLVGGLIEDAGFVAVDLGAGADCSVMEAPRRPGALYGAEYRLADAQAVVAALHAGQPIPPPPHDEPGQ